MNTFYLVTGMLYSASGWEDGYIDCMGSLLVYGDRALAVKVAETNFFKGGFGYRGYFEAPQTSIKEASEDDLSFYGRNAIVTCDDDGNTTSKRIEVE